MATVSLTNGVTVLVDKRDVARVTRHNWYHHLCGASKPARARTKIGGQWVYMHRYILDLWDRDKVVDHINGDPLDNRRENLRVCLPHQNSRNSKKRTSFCGSECTSRYKGVSVCVSRPHGGKYGSYKYWRAGIGHDNEWHYLGQFKTEEDAARAYDKRPLRYLVSSQKSNFPLSDYEDGEYDLHPHRQEKARCLQRTT